MVGSVAVGVILVSRNTGAEVLSSAEQLKIVQEVQNRQEKLQPLHLGRLGLDKRRECLGKRPRGSSNPARQVRKPWRWASV